METPSHEALARIGQLRDSHDRACTRFKRTFAAIPDDKHHWKALPTCKSAVEIAAHVAGAHQFFVASLQGEEVPHDFEGAFIWIGNAAANLTTGPAAIQAFENSQATLDRLYSEPNLEAYADHPGYKFILELASFHPETHAGQLDFLQTCWDDQDFH